MEINNLGSNPFNSMGWECPKCGSVYSPHTPQCFNCRGGDYQTIRTTVPDAPANTCGYTSPQAKGGRARAAALPPERRSQIAQNAARARWSAQGIEAATAGETREAGLDAKHESPVGEADAAEHSSEPKDKDQ